MRILNKTSDLDIDRPEANIPTCPNDARSIVTQVRNNTILLGGRDGLNIIALQPKQKSERKDEATIATVLADRLGSVNKSVERSFTGKKMKRNLKKFRLKVDFFSLDGQLVGSSVSDTITDSKDRTCGAMDLQKVIPQSASIRGDNEVCMISEFDLAQDVIPLFKVYDSDGQHCPNWDQMIEQPDDTKLTRKKEVIVFKSPAQKPGVIKDLKKARKTIYVLFRRLSDKYESRKMLPFLYEDPEDSRPCLCHWQGEYNNKENSVSSRDLNTPEPFLSEDETKRKKMRTSSSPTLLRKYCFNLPQQKFGLILKSESRL